MAITVAPVRPRSSVSASVRPANGETGWDAHRHRLAQARHQLVGALQRAFGLGRSAAAMLVVHGVHDRLRRGTHVTLQIRRTAPEDHTHHQRSHEQEADARERGQERLRDRDQRGSHGHHGGELHRHDHGPARCCRRVELARHRLERTRGATSRSPRTRPVRTMPKKNGTDASRRRSR
jgi:hypothetical protein